MSNAALENIKFGSEDGTVTEFAIGDSVDALSKDEVASLVAAGLAGPSDGSVVEDVVDETKALTRDELDNLSIDELQVIATEKGIDVTDLDEDALTEAILAKG